MREAATSGSSDTHELAGALDGIVILDLSQGAAGPIAAMLLGDMGAEVVKVEPPGGEWGRMLGPPFTMGVATSFLAMNRNKRGIIVDLKRADGPSVVHRLARRSDVVLTSFRPGVTERLGIGYQKMAASKPGLIYVELSAWGPSGPWHNRPGVDGPVQAVSGIMSVTGTPDGPPVKVGVPAADMTGALSVVQSVLAALYVRERTGRGQRACVSLLQSMIAFQLPVVSMFLGAGAVTERHGSAAPYGAPNETYRTQDGRVMVAAYTPDRWPRLCAAVGSPDLAEDPRFDTNAKRVRNRAELTVVLESLFCLRTTAEWGELLDAEDVMWAPLLDYQALFAEPQLQETEALWSVEHPVAGPVPAVRNPVGLTVTPPSPRRPPPYQPGEHTREVLVEFGFTSQEYDALLAAGVVEHANGMGVDAP